MKLKKYELSGNVYSNKYIPWRLEPFRISFLLRSVYDTLPTPTNLYRWGMREDPQCSVCGERGTMAHILAGCRTALSQGRYRWRHDKVLRALADILEQERRKKHQPQSRPTPSIQFIREGEKPSSSKKTKKGLLQTAPSWVGMGIVWFLSDTGT